MVRLFPANTTNTIRNKSVLYETWTVSTQAVGNRTESTLHRIAAGVHDVGPSRRSIGMGPLLRCSVSRRQVGCALAVPE
ncbi:hypothetical protein BDV06DRAFT_22635 [Aspergillus oleicola]